MIKIIKLSRYNLLPLERELDRIAEKHDIEFPLRGMSFVDEEGINFAVDDDDDW